MIGASLSRWTMSYFAAALLALLAAETLMASGYGFPFAGLQSAETLFLVHLVALGWLSLLMSGALLQFVPVLIARPLHSETLPLPALLVLVIGLIALLGGFLQLDGQLTWAMPLLPIAGPLLGIGFALNLWNLGRTLWPLRGLPLPARFVLVGLLSVGVTIALGIVFTLVLSGVTANEHLLRIMAAGLPIHIVAGLGGWLTFSAIGVSYRLLAMFMLAPEVEGWSIRTTFTLGTLALALVILGGAIAICFGLELSVLLAATAVFGTVALAFYAFDIARLYRARKRRHVELNSRMAGLAVASLVAAAMLVTTALARGTLPHDTGAIVFLTAFGWLSGLGLAKLYKIVPFLTWLECYGPVLGKTPTPRVQDLVVESRAATGLWLYFAAVWLGTIALMIDVAAVFRATAAAMLAATAAIIAELVRARRLVEINAVNRIPAGAHRPRLFLCVSQQT
jgi:hypothetical protein